MTEALEGQESLFDRDTWFGRTFLGLIVPTEERISPPCWKKLSASQSQPLLFLDCRTSRSGQKPEESSEMDGASRGERTTPNTGEFPSADGESAWWLTLTGIPQGTSYLNVSEKPNVPVDTKLSQILEENPDPKYNLTPKACAGILRRAERRGKKLPEALKTALELQSSAYRATE